MKQKSITPNVPTKYIGRETIRENSRFSVCLRNIYKFFYHNVVVNNNLEKQFQIIFETNDKKFQEFFLQIQIDHNTIQNEIIDIENNIIKESRSCTLPGAGIDLDEYKMTPYPEESRNIRFLFIGRVMKEKGVEELFKAATNIKKVYPEASFDIVGPMEDDYKERIQSLVRNGIIYYYGYQEDVKPFIKKCDCFVLPSYHEGMANTLLECGAMGRPLITSRIHGCMEAVRDGENGYLVDVKDVKGLEEKTMEFIELSYEEKKMMGEKSREVMEERFDKEKVVEMTLEGLFR